MGMDARELRTALRLGAALLTAYCSEIGSTEAGVDFRHVSVPVGGRDAEACRQATQRRLVPGGVIPDVLRTALALLADLLRLLLLMLVARASGSREPLPSEAACVRKSDMNIIYKGMCDQCKAEVIIILRHVRTLENLRGQFKRTCMICERSEVMLEMQGFRGDTA
jgi:hypothetical protein